MKCVLVVEDSPAIIGLIGFLLTTFGYVSRELGDWFEALKITIEARFLNAGCSRYISKPNDIDSFKSILYMCTSGCQVLWGIYTGSGPLRGMRNGKYFKVAVHKKV
ncbi:MULTISPECIES: response regulator [unclassified Methanosarcina]|uniref:response regulator n=1 Tax=unclassified Methanosarcina TaxID=2644672 RepID=UPI00061574FC|nr:MULTISPECIES: response regulator [unclassified Methanosarcina]AKB18490.1 response regulator receiver [Methanosarcina sp. WWM596]AKB21943.1 response regulator receiver [Methanosarcina sp. WH1]